MSRASRRHRAALSRAAVKDAPLDRLALLGALVAALAIAALSSGCTEAHRAPAEPLVEELPPLIETLPPELVVESPTPVSAAPTLVRRSAEWVPPPAPPRLAARASLAVEPEGARQLAEVRVVQVGFDIIGAAGTPGATVEFVAPGGLTYERRSAALADSPFDVQRLSFELPVAGTVVDLNGLSGEWTARLFVNGVELATQTFELSP